MNMLANLKAEDGVVLEEEQDRVGGASRTLDSDIYKFEILAAYMGKSASEATSVSFILKDKKSGTEFKPTIYVTSGKAKGCKTYYTKKDEAAGKETNYPLPGFLVANGMCELTTGTALSEQETEEKVVKIYNFDSKSEVPTKVQMLVNLVGKEVYAAVLRQTVDKTKETSPGSGVRAATGETRDENEIDKVFCAREGYEHMTQTEIKAKRADDTVEASFFKTWLEANQGKTRNKAKGGGAGTAGAPGKVPAAGKPKSGLFS